MFRRLRLISRQPRARLFIAIVLAISLTSTGVVVATTGITGPDRLIATCYHTVTGQVRFVSAGTACERNEVSISLPSREYVDALVAAESSVRAGGDAALAQQLNAEITRARAGEGAATTHAFETGTSVLGPPIPVSGLNAANATSIVTLDLPAGAFSVSAVVHLRGTGHASVTCGAALGDTSPRIDTAFVGSAPGDTADTNIVLSFTRTLDTPGTASLSCWLDRNAGPYPAVVTSSLDVLLVGDRTFTRPPARVKIVSSLPLRGSAAADTQGIVNAITLALEEVSFRSGNVTIDYLSLDDSDQGNWSGPREAQNATMAAGDGNVVAYIGPFNSGAAKLSIPILCGANVAMISPSNTYPGLTKPGLGAPGEPGVFYPNGCVHNYTRVTPSDDVQGAVASAVAAGFGVNSAYVVSDGTPYGIALASTFRSTAAARGVTLVGDSAPPYSVNDVAARIVASSAPFVYFAGFNVADAALLRQALDTNAWSGVYMVAEGIATPEFVQLAGPAAIGTIATAVALAPAVYTPAQSDWARRYQQRFGAAPGVYALYGYEAANVVLAALSRAAPTVGNRAAVRNAVTSTTNFNGLLGPWSFDANGDTTFCTMTLQSVAPDRWLPSSTARC